MSRVKSFGLLSQTTGSGGDHTAGKVITSPYFGTYDSHSAGGAFHLIINFDTSVAKAPAAFVADVEKVADFFTSHFSNHATVTINVGYGEVDGFKVGRSALGESITYYTAANSYGSLKTAFNTTSLNDDPNAPRAMLPDSDPVSGKHAYWVTTAEGKAIGLLADNTSIDGYIGLSSTANTFDYDTSNGVTGYDFVGTVAHEISEVMGRQVLVGEKSQGVAGYMPLDLFHYSSPGVHDFSGTTPGYFSIDNGATDYPTKAFNTQSNADFGDWSPGITADSFDASGGQNQIAPVTEVDYLAMESTGWTGTGWSSDWS